MRHQQTRPVVIPLGPKLVVMAAILVGAAVFASILTWLGWMPG